MTVPLSVLEPTKLPLQSLWEKNFCRELKERKLKPIYVQWLCTHKCNFRCPHCGTAASEAKPQELKAEEIIPVIDNLAEIGCKLLSLTGGEPILRDDIFNVIKHAKEMGIGIGFVTNGYAIEKYAKDIERTEVDSVLVSIDGYKENHDRIRGMPGAYKKAIQSIEILKKIGVPAVGVSTVCLKENLNDIPKIVDDVFAHGCDRHRIQSIVPEGRAKGKGNKPEEIKQVLRYVLDARKKGIKTEVCEGLGFLGPLEKRVRPYTFFCSSGWSTFTIMDDGTVMGCPATDFTELNDGSIRKENIKDIWWNRFQRFRETLYDDLPKNCKECKYIRECRGGCWLHRVNGDFCFLKIAEEVADELL